jgi:hypothetical protein
LPAKAVWNFVLGWRDPSLASQLLQKIVALHGTCRSRLAGEGGFEFCVGLEGPFAGKPAPTKKSWHCTGLVGAGLPAKVVLNFVLGWRDPSLASQLLQGALELLQFLRDDGHGLGDLLWGVQARDEEAHAGGFFRDGRVQDRLGVDSAFGQGAGQLRGLE